MERSPLFYETVWAAAYAAAYAAGEVVERSVYVANNAVEDLRAKEQYEDAGIVRRENLFHAIRAGSLK